MTAGMRSGPSTDRGLSRLATLMAAVALLTFAAALPAIGARASHGARVTAFARHVVED